MNTGNRIALLPTAYLGPIQYYSKIINYEEALIEHCEHFQKQTFRNRCNIYGANGELSLSIPLKKRGERTPVKDIRISYEQPWQKLHWRSFGSSYRCSPFFEFYEDDFAPFYEKRYEFLIDLNAELHQLVCDLLKIDNNTKLTEKYEKTPSGMDDFRELISPKVRFNDDPSFIPKPYTQVFINKHGFLPNLSIVDLLFNQGSSAKEFI
jgi:hypothetical protein